MTVLRQLKHDLLDAYPRVMPAPVEDPPSSRSRTPLGLIGRGLPMAAAVAVAVVVAAAILVLGVHRGGASRPESPVAAPPGRESTSRQALIASLGVLREPQTTQDRAARFEIPGERSKSSAVRNAVGRPLGFPEADRSLSRVLALPALQGRFEFLPVTFRPGASSQRVEGLAATLRLPNLASTGLARPITVGGFRARGLLLSTVLDGKSVNALALPDGVARVKLGPISQDHPTPVNSGAIPAQTLTVRDNLVVLTFTPSEATSRRFRTSIYFVSAHVETIWFAADGHVIKHVRLPFQLPVQVRHAGHGTGCIAGPFLNYDGCDGPPKPVG
jgi:hypothetical protein